MPNYLLTAIKSDDGFIFICPQCETHGIATLGANDEERRHLLTCPICGKILGAWLTSESRERVLTELAEKLERSFARGSSDGRRHGMRQMSISRFLQRAKDLLRALRIGRPQRSRVHE